MAGHHILVASQVSSSQPCGSNLEILKQEREQANFRRGSKGSKGINGRPPLFSGLPCVYITNMWLKVGNTNPRVFNISPEVRKTGAGRLRRRDNWLLQQLLASHPSVTFLVIKQRYLPKMNENRCKTNVRGPKHAVRGPGNCPLNTESGVRPRSGFLRPQCPSKGRK